MRYRKAFKKRRNPWPSEDVTVEGSAAWDRAVAQAAEALVAALPSVGAAGEIDRNGDEVRIDRVNLWLGSATFRPDTQTWRVRTPGPRYENVGSLTDLLRWVKAKIAAIHPEVLAKYGTPRSNPAKKRRKTSKSKKRAPRSRAYQIQALMLDRETFTEASARAWLKKNRHSAEQLSFSEDYIHAVQHPRGDYRKGSLHNIHIAKHVEATVGIPLSDSAAAETPGYNKRGPRQQRLKLAPRGRLTLGEDASDTYDSFPDTPF